MSNRQRRAARRALARTPQHVYPAGQEHLHRGDRTCRCRPRLEQWTVEHVTFRRLVHSDATAPPAA
jgi:hypothetical protein